MEKLVFNPFALWIVAGVHLIPAVVMRYLLRRKPLSKWISIAWSMILYFSLSVFYLALFDKKTTGFGGSIVIFGTYCILRNGSKKLSIGNNAEEQTSQIRYPGERDI